jgi:hypothetical protein
MDAPIWDVTVFTKKRDQLLSQLGPAMSRMSDIVSCCP